MLFPTRTHTFKLRMEGGLLNNTKATPCDVYEFLFQDMCTQRGARLVFTIDTDANRQVLLLTIGLIFIQHMAHFRICLINYF